MSLLFLMQSPLLSIHDRLLAEWGSLAWWPAESPFEVMVGAILVQNTSWQNVKRALDAIRAQERLSPRGLFELSDDELAELIRPSGYYRVKSRRLRNLLSVIVEDHAGSVESMLGQDIDTLREELLAINGIGPETADSIMLYAAEKPVFVVDTYTHRVMARHGWAPWEATYHDLQGICTDQLPTDVGLYNELHAQFVKVGHHWCKPTPRCDDCPLREYLPEGGICEE